MNGLTLYRLTRGRQARTYCVSAVADRPRIYFHWGHSLACRPRVKRFDHDNTRENIAMIHGYHLILPMYGFWLPNDPRGSWSDFVWKWELVRFGKATKTIDRCEVQELTEAELQQRDAARAALNYDPVSIKGLQALSIAHGFAHRITRSNYSVWACVIMPEHTHLVLARHTYKVEQMAKLLKAAATTEIIKDGRHPLATCQADDGTFPHMWAESHWKVYLDSDERIETAIRYVNENPEREGKKRQLWSFVSAFRGLEPGHITYH